jgi:hypothetical protein
MPFNEFHEARAAFLSAKGLEISLKFILSVVEPDVG